MTSRILRRACSADLRFLRSLSPGVSDDALRDQIRHGRLRIVQCREQPIGFLKFCVLWEKLPFIEVLVIVEPERGKGRGSRAVREWEREMKELAFDVVLTSTQADETAQRFWRKLGYVDCGSLEMTERPAELFLQRKLS